MNLIDNAIERLEVSPSERIVFYIIKHTDGNSKIFSRTYKQMQTDLNVSSATIADVLKVLEKNGTLIRAGLGKWYVPAVVGYEPENELNWGILSADD